EVRDGLLGLGQRARGGVGPPGGARDHQRRRAPRRRRHERHDLAHRVYRETVTTLTPVYARSPELVIPGPTTGRGPESMNTGLLEYGFRARRYAVPRNGDLELGIASGCSVVFSSSCRAARSCG